MHTSTHPRTLLLTLCCMAGSLSVVQAQETAPHAWTLKECIDHALEHNIRIRQTANETEMSRIEAHTARWSRLPDLNGSAGQNWSWGRSASPVDNSYRDINSANTNLGLSTSVPLFTGLRIPNGQALAKLNLKASIEDLRKAKEDVAINVTSAYLQVLFNHELSQVAQRQVELSREQLARIRSLLEAGKAAPPDVAEAQARTAQDEAAAVQADNTYRLSLLELSQLLELPTPEGFVLAAPAGEPSFGTLTPPDEIYAQALAYKPGIKAAEYRLEGSKHSLRMARSQLFPQLSFNAGLGSNYYTVNGRSENSFGNQLKNNLNKYIGFHLSVPLFDRFATRNRIRAERVRQTNLGLQLEETRKGLYKEIQQAWYNALAAESKYDSSAAAVQASEEAFRLLQEKLENGKATFIEYNEAKLNLAKVQSDRLQAKYDYIFRTKILDFYKGVRIE